MTILQPSEFSVRKLLPSPSALPTLPAPSPTSKTFFWLPYLSSWLSELLLQAHPLVVQQTPKLCPGLSPTLCSSLGGLLHTASIPTYTQMSHRCASPALICLLNSRCIYPTLDISKVPQTPHPSSTRLPQTWSLSSIPHRSSITTGPGT